MADRAPKSDLPLEVRRILVHSTGNAKGQQRARDKRLSKAREDLDKLHHSVGGRYYNTAEKNATRIGVIAKTRRVSGCLHTGSPQTESDSPPCPDTSMTTCSKPRAPSTAGTRC